MFKFEQKEILLGFFFAFLGTTLFALKSIFIKLAYQQGLDADTVLMLRMAISLPIYLLIIGFLSRKNSPKTEIKNNFLMILLLGFIGYALASWLDLKGLEHISASLERLTLFTYPIFVVILGALFFNTPLTKKIIGSLLLSYLGLWIVFSQELNTHIGDTTTGVLLVLSSALSYACYVLLSKKIIHLLGSLWFTALAMSVSSVLVLGYYFLIFDFNVLDVSNMAWFWIAMLAVVSTVIPSFMISEAIVKIGSAQTGIIGTLGPIITIGLGVWILDEFFNLYYGVGIIFIITGVALLTVKKS
ncbi:MAG: hypothetical protein Ctma_0362 [Catillopecten margaritatus gill symbiont]|uniref:EamA domain-containing protein n=1 Tax=Catillopecten margaritatus gill symbiont TaxID=3083288 RepID=A0AAU6PFA6_9GAMM